MLPKRKEVQIPLLEALIEIGGQGKPRHIYPLVTKRFPQIREEDLADTLPAGHNRWINRIQWVRQDLVHLGEMDSPKHGIWRITEKGRQRLANLSKFPDHLQGDAGNLAVSPPSFLELYEDYEAAFRIRLLESLQNLTPTEFEQFGRRLLIAYGFVETHVTQVSNDGGIDGYGKLRLGLAVMNVAFQCKKWQGNVSRPEVDKFRGAIQGEYEQGVFLATSDFSKGARDASIKKGAVPIILINGEGIVDLMIKNEIGVKRVPLYAFYEQFDNLIDSESDE